MNLTQVDRRWHWIDDGLLPFALAAMRALWIWLLLHLWSQGLATGTGELFSPFTVFALLCGGTLVTQLGIYRVQSGQRATQLVVGAGLVAVVLALYIGLAVSTFAPWQAAWIRMVAARPGAAASIIAVAIWLWWWGILTGREPPGYDTYSRNFALGMAALALAVAITYATHIVPLQGVLLALLCFFAIGLGTLAIAALQETRRYERRASDQWFALSRYWLGTVAGVIGILLAAGILLAQVFVPDAITRLLALLTVLSDPLARLLLLIVYVFAYVVFGVVGWLAKLLHVSPHAIDLPTLATPNFADQFKNLQNEPTAVPPGLYLAFRIIGGLVLAAIIISLFAYAFRRFRTYAEEDVEESRDSVLTLDLLKDQLAQLFRRRRGVMHTIRRPFVPVTGNDPRAEIRRIYQALLAWAAVQGFPRSRDATPSEYAVSLGSAFPSLGDRFDTITAAYMSARYSDMSVSDEIVESVASAWLRISVQMNDHRRSGNGG